MKMISAIMSLVLLWLVDTTLLITQLGGSSDACQLGGQGGYDANDLLACYGMTPRKSSGQLITKFFKPLKNQKPWILSLVH